MWAAPQTGLALPPEPSLLTFTSLIHYTAARMGGLFTFRLIIA